MTEHVTQLGESLSGERESPLHGYRGNPTRYEGPFLPPALTVAVSREAGSRGTSIAQRAGQRLGWQVYTQEMLEYLAQEDTVRQDITSNLSPAALKWIEDHLRRMQADGRLAGDDAVLNIARVIMALGATGEVVLIGRGAGYILPRPATLHVRIIAPLADRIAYMSQWQRQTRDEAAAEVAARDMNRSDYLRTHFHRDVADIYQYDLLLNSALLGEELSADLLVQAARTKAGTLIAGDGG